VVVATTPAVIQEGNMGSTENTKQYERLTEEMDDLLRRRSAITNNPANRSQDDTIWLYTKSARRRLDKIDRAIADIAAQRRALQDQPVSCDGYSGRQSNKG
jgi:hypothetical protein